MTNRPKGRLRTGYVLDLAAIREKSFFALLLVILVLSFSLSHSMDLNIGTMSSKFRPVFGSMALTAPNIS